MAKKPAHETKASPAASQGLAAPTAAPARIETPELPKKPEWWTEVPEYPGLILPLDADGRRPEVRLRACLYAIHFDLCNSRQTPETRERIARNVGLARAAVAEGGADVLEGRIPVPTKLAAAEVFNLLSEVQHSQQLETIPSLKDEASRHEIGERSFKVATRLGAATATIGYRAADAPAPTPNPLLAQTTIHADLNPLFNALVDVSAATGHVEYLYGELVRCRDEYGPPAGIDHPDHPARQPENLETDEVLPERTRVIRDWRDAYRSWCDAIAKAKDAARSSAVAAIMDAGEARPTHRWTAQTISDLNKLADMLRPMSVGGGDGLGFIRCGLPTLPTDFPARAEAVGKRIGELRAIPVSAVPPTPTAARLPTLKPWALEAWQANQAGQTVTAIAETLAKKYNDPKITQPRVSEQIKGAKAHAEASGLASIAAKVMPQTGSRAPARTLDPAAAEQGKRTDVSAHYLRERERQRAKDSDDE